MSIEPPRSPKPLLKVARPRYGVPYLILLVALILTAVATGYVEWTVRARDEMRFESSVRDSRNRIENHVDSYVDLLLGAAGLFAASNEVSPEEFRAYVARLNISDQYPGLQGIGFSRRIPPGQRAAVEAQMRRFHVNFRIWSEDETAELHSIIYLEPLDALNRRAIGFNMFSEPVRRAAMSRARDTGESAASGKVRLKQEGEEGRQAGFLVYTPVYSTGETPGTLEGRRRALDGFVYSPYRMGDFIRGAFASQERPELRLSIWDGMDREPIHLLYESDDAESGEQEGSRAGTRVGTRVGSRIGAGGPHLSADTVIHVPGRNWSVHFETTRYFQAASSHGVVPLTLLGGLTISALLFGITLVQARSRDAAERAAEDLRKSEARARRLVEANVIGVVFSRLDGEITGANDAFLEMLGYTREDLNAGRLTWSDITPPEYAVRAAAAAEDLRGSGKHSPYEKEVIRADGTRVPVLLGATRLEPGSNLAVGYMMDLSEQKRAQEAVRAGREELRRLYAEAQDARAAAEEANRLKDEFLATVSHELRTPLNAIMGYAQLLRMTRRGPEDTARALEAIERNVRAQAQLIEDLLDVSRIISGKLRLDVQRVDLDRVVFAAVESVAPAAAAKDISLDVRVDPDVGPLTGDPARLQQVAWNLLTNAIKFTGPEGRVTVRVARREGHVELAVEDTGAGIAPEFLPHIFDRFRQVDSSTTRRYGGLGLGLSIVRNLVEMHGGSVHAESEGEGRGSTFIVRLPMSLREEARHDRRPAPAIPTDGIEAGAGHMPGPDLRGLRVLVVDDEPDALSLLEQVLCEYGADVRAEPSAEAAMAAFPSFRPDVLVSDIAMPGEDGYSLIRRIRALGPDQGGNVPAAALTAFARAEDRSRALQAGYQIHVAKPVEPGDLLAIIADLAGRKG